MKIEGKHYCDFCCVEFEKDPQTGRLFAGRKEIKGFRGPVGVLKFAVHALFGTLLCEDCDTAIVRKAAPKIPVDLKYVRGVESGKISPPFKMSVKRGDVTDHLPIKLNAEGRPVK